MNQPCRIALDVSGPNEPSVGAMTAADQKWLASAFDHLRKIYDQRQSGDAYCIFEVGNWYVQFLAEPDAQRVYCEAVSANSNPEVAAILGTTGDATLRTLGFDPPGKSPNYSQEIDVAGPESLAYAARLSLRVFKQVYHEEDLSAGTFQVHIPTKTPRKINSKANAAGATTNPNKSQSSLGHAATDPEVDKAPQQPLLFERIRRSLWNFS